MIRIKTFGGSLLPGSNEKTLKESESFLNSITRANIIDVNYCYIGTSGTLRVFLTYEAP
jgi:hypothetical protein